MKKRILLLLIVIITLLCAFFYNRSILSDHRLRVHFINVGQGDATLVISPQGKTMLIDAGNNEGDIDLLSYLRSCGVKKIDVLIGTHPDSDHIGGMDTVINHFPIGKFYLPMKYHQTKSFNDVLYAAKKKGLAIQPVYVGESLPFDETVQTDFLNPIKDKYYQDNNSYSAVVKLKYKQVSFLFMGDADKNNEAEMIAAGYDLDVDVLKLGHHGSSTSTSERFIDQVSPSVVIISCGFRNKYGHPHRETLTLLQQKNVPLYRTDEQGDIVIRSDGYTMTSNRRFGSYTFQKN